MIHLRIVAPKDVADWALDVLTANHSVCNVVHLPGAARKPEGDVILCDVAREDGSVVLSDLRELGLGEEGKGSVAIEDIDAQISEDAELAEKHAKGAPSDAVVWEEVEARTAESTELSHSFLAFMMVAALIAAVGIYLDSAILIVGAMVVGPEFGPIAGFCIAVATKRADMAARSMLALAVGFPAAITAVWLATLVFKATGLVPGTFEQEGHGLAAVISSPDFFSFFVASCAAVAGILSLSTAKSGALIGVLISVTTIPAAANIGISAAYADWATWRGSMAQLAINLAGILLAGMTTLYIQRLLYRRRRIAHLSDPERGRAGLPVGRSLRRGRAAR